MAVARRLRAFVFILSALSLALPALGAEKPRVQVDSYAINAELNPKTHHLIAAARLKFTALDEINSASFELNNALRPRVLDAAGKPLAIERISQESLVRVWKALAKYDQRASLSTWIYTITRNRCLTAIERRRDLDSLSERGRCNYLFARAMVGREFATPSVRPA